MAARRFTVEVLGEARQLNRTLGQVDDRLGKFGKHTERVGKGIATLFAADALRRGLGVIVGAAQEAAAVARQTEAVIKSTGGAAGLSAKGFADLASQIAKTAAVDDDLVQAGENILATFTNIKASGPDKIFQRAEQAAVDMAAAMGHGEVTAEGLQTANIQLGKALNDPIKGMTALQKIGVTFTQQQKDQIKTLVEHGQLAKAQGVILAEVNKEFGGSAAAAATGAKRFTAAVGNLEESLGGALLPVMEQGATAAAKLAEGFTDLDKSTGGLASKLTLGAVGLAGVGVVAGKTIQFISDSKKAWAALRAAKLANVAVAPAVVAAETATGTAAAASGAAAGTAATKFGAMRAAVAGIGGVGSAAAAAVGSIAAPIAAAAAALIGLAFAQSKVEKAMDHQEDGVSRATRAWHDNVVEQDRYQQLSADGKKTFDEIDAKIRKATEATKQQATATTAVERAAKTNITALTNLTNAYKPLHPVLVTARDDILGMADGFEHGKRASSVSARAIIGDLNNEVATLKTWASDAQKLLRRGMDPAAVEFLSKKGPEFLHAFATGSDAQVASFERLFKGRVNAAADAAWVASVRSTSAFTDFRAKSNAEIAKISNKPAREKLSQLLSDLSAGKVGITEFRVRWNAELAKLKNAERIASVIARLKSPEVLKSDVNKAKHLIGLAGGGPVRGVGTTTSDSNLYRLSRDEHVVSAREVHGAGGHGAVERQRAMWRDAIGVPGLAKGGPAFKVKSSGLTGLGDRIQKQTQIVDDFVYGVGKTMAALANQQFNKAAGVGGPGIARALRWARTQVGKPYVWGGVGPGGYDCSGFMSAITNVVMGRSPYHRLFATGSFPTSGWNRGFVRPGFSIGSRRGRPGHMAGTLGGVNVESRGSAGVVVGAGARGATSGLFGGNVWHLAGRSGANSGRELLPARIFDDGGFLPSHSATVAINKTSRAEPVGFDYDKLAAAIVKAQGGPSGGRQPVQLVLRDGRVLADVVTFEQHRANR